MTEEIYWIWLQAALGVGSVKVDKVLEEIGSAREFYELDEQALRETKFLTQKEIRQVKAASLDDAKRLYERAQRLHVKVVTPGHPDYPPKFTHICCKPCVLYVLGELCASAPLSVTIVGARKSTEYGIAAASQLSRELAAAGCQVVSGLAVGIDQTTHRAALSVHGRTVGFMASGMKVPYPSGSAGLKRQILDEGGALVSEFPFDSPAEAWHFPVRNRLMSGISEGTVVVQASKGSGALITATHALDQGRTVFAVPGSIFDKTMWGCNNLLRDGATIVTGLNSILEPLLRELSTQDLNRITEALQKNAGHIPADTKLERKRQPKETPPPKRVVSPEELEQAGVSERAQLVYNALGEETIDCDVIVSRTGLEMSNVLGIMTELELFDLIVPEPGRRYRRR